ncbi:hypothetical protein ZIOFF_021122 [Zingiber officinale]|uniref:UDENN domain-containing protein n=1 Tax=Zingiber officinale TaxID=94328 RepID=A0A8J5H6H9_ZINOF|nr:hypothetical protein ZIOFF_021122 [Zingiber officinale]
MNKSEDSGSPGWGASLFMQTEDVARTFFSVASAATAGSPRPSAVFSSGDMNVDSHFQKLQRRASRLLKGFSSSPEQKGSYNPEVLTSQKRQWAGFQLRSSDQRAVKEPSKLFESMVVVGLHPNADVQALRKIVLDRNNSDPKRRSLLNYHHQVHSESVIAPQVLFVYPPDKQVPLKYKDLLSFCFPGGVEVHAVERTPSMSELNEIMLGQEQLKQSNQSFVFRLKAADNSTLYGCCVLVEELLQSPSSLVSLLIGDKPCSSPLSRHILTTSRCYCILSRLPFFDLHFGILRSIFIEERLEWLTKGSEMLNLLSTEETSEDGRVLDITYNSPEEEYTDEEGVRQTRDFDSMPEATSMEVCKMLEEEYGAKEGERQTRDFDSASKVTPKEVYNSPDEEYAAEEGLRQARDSDATSEASHKEVTVSKDHDSDPTISIQETAILAAYQESMDLTEIENGDIRQNNLDDSINKSDANKQQMDAIDTVLPLFHCPAYESSESSSSLQGSPCEGINLRRNNDDSDLEEPSSSGQEDLNRHSKILEWAKVGKLPFANCNGSLQIICQYYGLECPARGSTLTFKPLEHLHPLDFHRPGETVLHIAGSTIDIRSGCTSLEMTEVHHSLLAEEEATALSVWTVATLCGCLGLDRVMNCYFVTFVFFCNCQILVMLAGALLEKQIVVVCSNLGVLSASVLSVVPLIRPYQWHSLLMPVLPNDILDFLDAPVPYIVGIKNKTTDIQSKLTSVILVDADKNQVTFKLSMSVRSSWMPQLPQKKELFSSLSPYHAKLVGESYLARRRPVYECTDVQIEAAKGFLAVIRSYLDSFCSNLRSHTITNVQSNNDKVCSLNLTMCSSPMLSPDQVSVLLKDSYIDSFPYRDRPFMKLFVDTQLFSVHTDLVLAFYQKD